MKQQRKDRCKGLLRRCRQDAHLSILFTDEKVFTVEQVLNKQNDRIYAKSRSHTVISRKSHPQSVMVFAGITSNGKTPLIFVPQGVKVNSANYLDLLRTEVLPWAQTHFQNKPWTYQQDSAPLTKLVLFKTSVARTSQDSSQLKSDPPFLLITIHLTTASGRSWKPKPAQSPIQRFNR